MATQPTNSSLYSFSSPHPVLLISLTLFQNGGHGKYRHQEKGPEADPGTFILKDGQEKREVLGIPNEACGEQRRRRCEQRKRGCCNADREDNPGGIKGRIQKRWNV